MIQLVPIDPSDGPFQCGYCGYGELERDMDGAYIVLDHPGFYFCSEDCAEDFEVDNE